ncbi:hypothetical protein C8Q74DRAFT_988616 [Fomes fomentarius]|nr:hypothetical protein C8Q74DRAFT_988616 [Fomes fomentarius]
MFLCSTSVCVFTPSLWTISAIPLHPPIAAECMDALYSLEFHNAITRIHVHYHRARYSTAHGSITMGECLNHGPEDDTHMYILVVSSCIVCTTRHI